MKIKNQMKIATLGCFIVSALLFTQFLNTIEGPVRTPVECKVLENYNSQTVHKYQVTDHFILVLKDPKGRVFDTDVSPSTFYIANKDKHICLMLTEYDITKVNTISEGLCFFLIISSILFLFLTILCAFESFD